MEAFKLIAISSVGIFLLVSAPHAQVSLLPSSPSAPTGTSPNVGDMAKSLGIEALKLREETERGLQRLQELQAALATNHENTKNAGKMVDDLLRVLRDAESRLSPDGAFANLLRDQERTVRDWANRARANRNAEIRQLAKSFEANADEIAKIRREAEQSRTKFIGEIDKLEQRREVLEFGLALLKAEEFIKDAKEYLDVVNGMYLGTKALSDNIGTQFPGTIPTQ
jgi:hypothetical protein